MANGFGPPQVGRSTAGDYGTPMVGSSTAGGISSPMAGSSTGGIGPSGGIQSLLKPRPTSAPFQQYGDPASFTAGAQKQANDYDSIMQQYRDLSANISQNPLTATSISPVTSPYQESGDVASSLSKLSNLADTGGLSASEIQNIRERDISPIRSIYAQGEQEMQRQRALGGGYSPNYNASAAQMARDLSNTIADKTTAANAGIAEMQQRGRLSAAPAYASAAGAEAGRAEQAGLTNAEITNQINQANADRFLNAQLANRRGMLDTISGQTSLYGTTPALTSTFGNQVIQAGELGQGQQALNQRRRDANLGFAARFG